MSVLAAVAVVPAVVGSPLHVSLVLLRVFIPSNCSPWRLLNDYLRSIAVPRADSLFCRGVTVRCSDDLCGPINIVDFVDFVVFVVFVVIVVVVVVFTVVCVDVGRNSSSPSLAASSPACVGTASSSTYSSPTIWRRSLMAMCLFALIPRRVPARRQQRSRYVDLRGCVRARARREQRLVLAHARWLTVSLPLVRVDTMLAVRSTWSSRS